MLRDLPKGDIPLLVLATLSDAPRHGYAIAREIERISENALQLREGSLYPALRVLETDGMIVGKWEIQPTGPARKIYSLSDKGRVELERRTREWHQYAAVISAVLGKGGPNEQPA